MTTIQEENAILGARIKVIGIGGGGTNAINSMIKEQKCPGVEFYAMNTDAQHLAKSNVEEQNRILIATNNGKRLGLGAGSRPEVGRKAAEESREEIARALEGADMVYIAGGMGGGTGTGVAPVVAGIAKEMGILTVAVVTMPYGWEGKRRWNYAVEGRRGLLQNAHTVITVRNDSLTKALEAQGLEIGLEDAFKRVDSVLSDGVTGVVGIIKEDGVMNLDYADVETVMTHEGPSLMGIGYAEGPNRVEEATFAAIHNPLLERDIRGATGVILSVSGKNVQYHELLQAGRIVASFVDPDATLITGASNNPEAKDGELRITIVATGFPEDVIDEEYPGFLDGGMQQVGGMQQMGGMQHGKVEAPISAYTESVNAPKGPSSVDDFRNRLNEMKKYQGGSRPSWMQNK